MFLSKLIVFTLIIILSAFCITLACIPSTDDFSPQNPLWNGLSKFTSITRARLIATIDVEKLDTDTIVFIIGPSKSFELDEVKALSNYVARGGVVVIMDDFGSSSYLINTLGLQVRFTGFVLVDPLFKYKSSKLPKTVIHVRGQNFTVYFNYGTTIDDVGKCTCIGFSSPFSYLDIDLDEVKDGVEPYGPFCVAVVCRKGKGLIYIFADASVFINAMIDTGDSEKLAKVLTGGRRVYIVSDKWTESLYTRLRSSLVTFFNFAINSSFRYVIATLAALTAYRTTLVLYEYIRRSSDRKHRENDVGRIILKHPTWDPRILEKLANEVEPYE